MPHPATTSCGHRSASVEPSGDDGAAISAEAGQRLSARDFDRQVAEFRVRVAVLNGFTALGTPISDAKR
jgi:hypothetical protein